MAIKDEITVRGYEDMPAFGERAKALMSFTQKDEPKQKWSHDDANWNGYRSEKLPQGISEALDLIEKNGGDYVSDEIEKYSPNRALMPYDVSNTYVRLLQDYPKETVDKAFRAAAEKHGDGRELYTQYNETTPVDEQLKVYWPLREASYYGDKAYRTPANRGEEVDLKLENASRKYGFIPTAIKDRVLKMKAEQEKAEKAEILKSLMSEFTDEELAQIASGGKDLE